MPAQNTTDDKPAKTEISYRVTVTKVIKNFPFRNREYKKIDTATDEYGQDKDEYGYVYFDDSKNVEITVYEQRLESVDMPEIIKAVNGMDD